MFVNQKLKICQVFITVRILFFSLFFYLFVENDMKIFDTNYCIKLSQH